MNGYRVTHWLQAALLALVGAVSAVQAQTGDRSDSGDGPRPLAGVPPMPSVTGPLDLRVVYPKWRDLVDAPDTSFIFGSTGTGAARLTVNGYPAKVWPNGAWFAWIPFPQDSLMEFHLVARTSADSAELTYLAQRASRFVPPGRAAWVDSTAIHPRGPVWWPAGEPLPVAVRAAPGASVRLLLTDGTVIPLAPDPGPGPVPWGIRAFGRDPAKLRRAPDSTRYVGAMMPRPLGYGTEPLPPVLGDSGSGPGRCRAGAECTGEEPAAAGIVEAVVGADTARVAWRVRLAPLAGPAPAVELDDDLPGDGDTDGITIGRAAPGGTFHWFFPRGTRAPVTGRIDGALRLRLSDAATAWVPEDEARPLAPGVALGLARVGFVTLSPGPDRVTVRIPVARRVPFRVEESGSSLRLRLYGTWGDVNWIRYGGTDSLVDRVDWRQDRTDETVLEFELSKPVWGYRAFWDGGDLLLEIRRPPPVDPTHPLAGRFIMLDPGHPPFGAKGPTGLREAEANLAVALRVRDLLVEAGARVVMTRVSDSAVGLWPRVRLADSLGVEILVSIHNNALPDGVNPFLANGSSVYYFHPHSVDLARSIQRALRQRLGLRNLGVTRGNLALTRPTWMPAVLTEGLFIMMPEQEAALRTVEGQGLYAAAVVDGLREFLAAHR